jgi:CRP-like cAMP-binding protein
MSLLTGERRSATVRAQNDCYVMEIGKKVMGDVIRESPECLRQLSEILATRKLETEGIIKEAANLPPEHAEKELEYRATFLARLRTMFAL